MVRLLLLSLQPLNYNIVFCFIDKPESEEVLTVIKDATSSSVNDVIPAEEPVAAEPDALVAQKLDNEEQQEQHVTDLLTEVKRTLEVAIGPNEVRSTLEPSDYTEQQATKPDDVSPQPTQETQTDIAAQQSQPQLQQQPDLVVEKPLVAEDLPQKQSAPTVEDIFQRAQESVERELAAKEENAATNEITPQIPLEVYSQPEEEVINEAPIDVPESLLRAEAEAKEKEREREKKQAVASDTVETAVVAAAATETEEPPKKGLFGGVFKKSKDSSSSKDDKKKDSKEAKSLEETEGGNKTSTLERKKKDDKTSTLERKRKEKEEKEKDKKEKKAQEEQERKQKKEKEEQERKDKKVQEERDRKEKKEQEERERKEKKEKEEKVCY